MADVKISALPAASTPLTGAEVLPIVQSSVTTKVAVSNLTAGLAGTATININGTVGATTPAAGAFTTVSASGVASFANGAVGTPSVTFTSDPDSGMFRIGANNLGVAVNGAKVLDISTTGLGVTGTTLSGDGTVSLPGIGFASDPDNGIFRIGTNNFAIACAGANVMEFKSGGEITMPLQPAFSAYNSATRSNVTGDGTNYTVVYDTEIYDRGGDFNNSTYTFTAPVTGIYSLKGCLLLTGLDNDPTALNMSLVTSNRTYNAEVSSSAFPVANYQMDMIRDCDMDAGDTALVRIQVFKAPSSLSANVYGNATNFYTIFQGRLAC